MGSTFCFLLSRRRARRLPPAEARLSSPYFEKTAPGAILVAPLPPEGAIGLTLKFVRKHPSKLRIGNTPNLTREYSFSASLPDDRVAAYESRLGDEFYSAFRDMLA